MYLLDTVTVSELRRPKPDTNVLAWIDPVPTDDLYLSVFSIFEIQVGIEKQRKSNPGHAADLSQWLDRIIARYGSRILPLSIGIARRWAELSLRIGHRNIDLAIAATALEHDFTVVTRNIADFAPTGVPTHNPFQLKRR